ncbi:hypothetical protein L226DRAFT_563965 [Lentinus tigrinus ALCF2SS1-7]|uniref:Fungal-type protein kinase domain-containing protein n=1 Tax=Lentinus tigrinus ALCF2SS1-6 TaxID=1328759 RepID=A0A5C2RNW8_9APHY|nr:hypothetical protein L227DRAFT_604679 [Lentinus tigrinus ALCF2SS1-6]RPD68340.1 hypothetical protein L226DRAFT_563965 [Lentinus tigrinus ALCF2SS1-7]
MESPPRSEIQPLPQSTPVKPTSSKVSTAWTPAQQRLQDELLELMAGELGEQTWQFPPDDIARMLSPKIINAVHSPGELQDPYPPLARYTCLIDDDRVGKALDAVSGPKPLQLDADTEKPNYKPVANFLNECVSSCKTVYSSLRHVKLSPFKLAMPWFPNLVFSTYDRPTGDMVAGAPALKPDIVAGGQPLKRNKKKKKKTVCYWSRGRQGWNGMEIAFAVEVKNNWKVLVKQAATYARAQISAIPLRAFSLVIGVNHSTNELRFLLYHRGGLTASRPIRIDTAHGVLQVQKVLFSIILWQTPQDAGLPSFTNGDNFLLPSSASHPDQVVQAVADQVLFHSLSVRGRGTLVVRAHPTTNSSRSSLQPARQLRRSARATRAAGAMPHTLPMAQGVEPVSIEPEVPEGALPDIVPRRYHALPLAHVTPHTVTGPGHASSATGDAALVLKGCWPTKQKRGLERTVYNDISGQFGVPRHRISFEVCREDGSAFSNAMFLPPPDGEWASYHWRSMTRSISEPDYRTLSVTATEDEGYSLERCTDAWDLSLCTLHCLLGWLNYMKIGNDNPGVLHRDISIGNLVKLVKPRACPSFTTRGVANLLKDVQDTPATDDLANALARSDPQRETAPHSLPGSQHTSSAAHSSGSVAVPAKRPSMSAHAGSTTKKARSGAPVSTKDSGESEHPGQTSAANFWGGLKTAAAHDAYLLPLVVAAERLESALAKLGVSTECQAVTIDADMSAFLGDYFTTSTHAGAVSGTPEFMSVFVRSAMEAKESYLQSPVDDLLSFWYTVLWATLFNPDALKDLNHPTLVNQVKKWRKAIAGTTEERESVVSYLAFGRIASSAHSVLLKVMAPLLVMWYTSLAELGEQFLLAFKGCTEPRQKLLVFYRFAYEGVAEYAELLHERRGTLQASSLAGHGGR